jgi:hypothetical protein
MRVERGPPRLLLLRLGCFAGLIDNERLYPRKFFLESWHEIVRPIFKQNDKTERKKQE